ncbi:HlyD family secretion protein [Falsiroseomonas tokyonensis]|uniref:HlyD family secretion protein n=1 Tax=Falsiroseomonas tokyonensis TaxID=430521 RepID=A0ABV7BQK1_9PROT|nr:HlyD family efflux transporter periplasmic adaptor subunit [Falsiroseomonas tokyonensis]MBU8537496.1 HlyD family efflux transporter periplasmic adaptor subunit [Falsiroseomonas tokyonensis]
MRGRFTKVLLGLILVCGALYAIVGEQLAGTSASAVVNAQVTVLRAPLDGEVSFAVRSLGTRLDAGEPVASVIDPRPDDLRLVELERAAGLAAAELRRLQHLRAALNEALAGYERQASAYADGRVRQLEARIAETQAVIDGSSARLREADATLQRTASLNRSGVQTVVELNRSRAAYEVAQQELEAGRNRLRYLTVELDAARQGVFIGDSYSDSPYSQQRAQELATRVAELRTEINEKQQRLDLLRGQIDDERVRTARFKEARISAPTRSILWELVAGPGEYVRRAQDVARLVDCTTTMVTATVRESLYNSLRVGDPVQFRLLGSGQVFAGSVARLAGSGAESIYRSLAIGPSAEQLKRFDVALNVPVLPQDPELGCAVGRTGRVVFAARPLDFWRRLVAEYAPF